VTLPLSTRHFVAGDPVGCALDPGPWLSALTFDRKNRIALFQLDTTRLFMGIVIATVPYLGIPYSRFIG
jgi:hypothetical protein